MGLTREQQPDSTDLKTTLYRLFPAQPHVGPPLAQATTLVTNITSIVLYCHAMPYSSVPLQ